MFPLPGVIITKTLELPFQTIPDDDYRLSKICKTMQLEGEKLFGNSPFGPFGNSRLQKFQYGWLYYEAVAMFPPSFCCQALHCWEIE
jgi:hypothetical protein